MTTKIHEEGEGGGAGAAGATTTGSVGNTPGTDTGWGVNPPKKKMARRKTSLKEFLEGEGVSEAIKGWKHAHSDIMKARADASAASNSVVLHQLRADGKESGMHDARKSFRTDDEARAHVENIKKLNPTRKYRYNKYVNGQHVGIIESEEMEMSAVQEFFGIKSFDDVLCEGRKLTHIQVRPNSNTHPDHLGKIGQFGDKMDLSDDDQYNKAVADAHAYGKEKYGEGKYDLSHVDMRGGQNYAIRAGSVPKVRCEMKKAKVAESVMEAHDHMYKGHPLSESVDMISEVEVQGAERYEYTHGKKPKGFGNWYFSKHKSIDFGAHKEGEDHVSIRGTYGEAKKQATAWAKSKGHAVIHVQT